MDYERKLNQLIVYALKNLATDIHITQRKSVISMEMRSIQGLRTISDFKISASFIEYIKFRTQINMLSAFKPQTKRFEINILNTQYFLRLAYVKNNQLETFVIRILNPPQLLSIDSLFDQKEQNILLREYLNHTTGLLLISGSTGSGKTTTLYSILDDLIGQKIYTIEDPIESIRDHLVQFEVNNQTNFGFQEAIKQVLRHDPNIIVISEIRSPEEAQAALRCALSGHLVLSTIHANSAIRTLSRLKEFNLDMEMLSELLIGVIYQKLETNDNHTLRKASFEFYSLDSKT